MLKSCKSLGLVLSLTLLAPLAAPQSLFQKQKGPEQLMSPMGRLAHRQIIRNSIWKGPDQGEDEGGYMESAPGGQSETSVAVGYRGKYVVLGYNDFRGFSPPAGKPISVSGFAYSSDGGLTFTDGGQLPVNTVPVQSRNGSLVPQVFGDPEVVYMGGSTFLYFSICVVPYSTSGVAQTMCFHRSTDNGRTWQGPYEITPATNPNGLMNGLNAYDGADKELADIDPDSGRVIMSWSNFTQGTVEICTTFADGLATSANVAWSPKNILNKGNSTFDTGSIPRFAGRGSKNVYVAWSEQNSWNLNVGFARSTDNGATFQTHIDTRSTSFYFPDHILGNDRIHSFPWLAVDNSPGPHSGSVYLVYCDNNTRDGGDIAFQRSTNGGAAFSGPTYLDRYPGSDRAQWFPLCCVDNSNGRLHVAWNDQAIDPSGDRMEMIRTYSDDGGFSFTRPQSVNESPFHAGYGNDTGQPNLGDYNEAHAQSGRLLVSYALNPERVLFTDGLPNTRFPVPDSVVAILTGDKLAASLRSPSFADARGHHTIDPGGTLLFTFPLWNYTMNPHDSPTTFTDVKAAFASTTPGVIFNTNKSSYPDILAGKVVANATPISIRLSPTFVPGTPIDFNIHVSSSQGTCWLTYRQYTGTAAETLLLYDNFEEVAPGTLPGGWNSLYMGGANDVPWTTKANVLGATSNGAFHINADDGANGDNNRIERLVSPYFVVPNDAKDVTLDFDTAYVTEDSVAEHVLAYDGFFVRFADYGVDNLLVRPVLAEAFATDITYTVGNRTYHHMPRHFPRSGSSWYFQDMSGFAGNSNGKIHVHMVLPGMANHYVRLWFEYTQDGNQTGANVYPGHPDYGVFIDNVKVNSVNYVMPPNSAPVGVNDFFIIKQDTTYTLKSPGLTSNDTDADNDALYVANVTTPTSGKLTAYTSGSFSYQPNPGFHGFDTFSYRPYDGRTSGNVTQVGIVVQSAKFGFGISPFIIKGGNNTSGFIYLTSAAPTGGMKISLNSNSPNALVPASVTIPAGSKNGKFTITTKAVPAATSAILTAKAGTETNSATLNITH